MGRDKLRKPKKDKTRRASGLERSVANYDGADLWALVYAMGSSPNLRARWGSLAAITHAALMTDWKTTGSNADVNSVEDLLAAARQRFPQLKWNEDYVAADPRLDVRVPVSGEVRRLFPGCIERPVADIDRAALTARALDAQLIEEHGFGICDVVQVVTKQMDGAINALEPSWPALNVESADPTGLLLVPELEGARAYLSLEMSCELSESEQLALEWLTVDVVSLPFDIDAPQSVFGRYARVRRGDATRWLPLAFLPEVLSFAVSEMASSVSNGGEARRRFAQESAAAARHHLLRFAPSILGPLDRPDGPRVTPANAVQWLTRVDEELILATQMVSEPGDIWMTEEPVVKRLADETPSADVTRVPIASVELGLPAGTDIISLLVASSPAHITRSPGGPGFASMSLDDLRWISATATDDLDLALFCRDLADTGGAMMFGLEVIDRWEPWRNGGKTFFNGGAALDAITFAPHGGEAEWERAATLSPIEAAICVLGLPVIHDLSLIERVTSKAPIVSMWRTAQLPMSNGVGQTSRDIDAWILHVGELPCAMAMSDEWSAGDRKLAFDVAGAIPFGIAQAQDEWIASQKGTSARGHVITLNPAADLSSDQLFTIVDSYSDDRQVQHTKVAVALEAFKTLGESADLRVRDELARLMGAVLLAAGCDVEAVARMVAAWQQAPPTLTVRVFDTMTRRNDLATPISFNESLVSEIDRVIAIKVKDAGVLPGSYFGDEAKALDRDILSIAALEALTEKLQDYEESDIVRFGMEQLERAQANRSQRLRSIQQTEESLAIDWDPIEAVTKSRSDSVQLRRALETIVEVALREQPTGTKSIHEVAWAELLAAANAYLEATTRSEGVHLQVSPLGIQVTDLFELKAVEDESPVSTHNGPPYRLDQNALGTAIATDQLASAAMAETVSPEMDDINASMQAAFGFTSIDLYATFMALASWPLQDEDQDVALASRDDVIQQVLLLTSLGEDPNGQERVAAVIASLITTGAELRDGPWMPWRARQRKRRLVAQPLAELPDGRLVVAPHYLLGTLSMYRNYLGQGVLPWTQPQPPKELDQALERFRNVKNRALEDDVAILLQANGWSVIQNIKETKPGRLNLEALSTEIDAVAGHPRKRTLLLIEAKDPASVHSLSHIRDQLDDFYLDSAKNRSYSEQLGRKHSDLIGHESEIAAALKLDPLDQQYFVRPMFVTRTPIPAAYVDCPYEFMTMDALGRVLEADSLD